MIEEARLWHVTVTVSGAEMEPLMVRAALQRLTQERPFISGIRFSASTAQIDYWDEADTLLDAASLALRMWNEHRDSARLPTWEVVALEVTERERRLDQSRNADLVDLKSFAHPF